MKINKPFKYKLCKQAEDLLNIFYKSKGESVDVFCIELYEPDDPQAEVTVYNYTFTVNIVNNYSHTVASCKYQGWCYDDLLANLGTVVATTHISRHTSHFYTFGTIKEVD